MVTLKIIQKPEGGYTEEVKMNFPSLMKLSGFLSEWGEFFPEGTEFSITKVPENEKGTEYDN